MCLQGKMEYILNYFGAYTKKIVPNVGNKIVNIAHPKHMIWILFLLTLRITSMTPYLIK